MQSQKSSLSIIRCDPTTKEQTKHPMVIVLFLPISVYLWDLLLPAPSSMPPPPAQSSLARV